MNPINLNSDFSLPDDLAIVGRITGVHGIKGWVKIRSYTQEQKKIFNLLKRKLKTKAILFDVGAHHGETIINFQKF